MSCNCFNKKVTFNLTDSFNTRLSRSKCSCASRFTVKENKRSFSVCCKDTNLVDKYKIDGYFDKSAGHKKCDYLFVYHHSSKETIIFVELKGTDIKHAIRQLDETISIFAEEQFFVQIKDFVLIGAIVSTNYPSDDATFRKLKTTIIKKFKKYNLRIEHKTLEMRYDPKRNRFMGRNDK